MSHFRRHFDLPLDISYLDAASISPRAKDGASVAVDTANQSLRPWLYRGTDKASLAQKLRELTAELIGAAAVDIALTPAVSYGIATAAANLPLAPGSRVLVLEGDHPSTVLVWQHAARAALGCVEVIPRPFDGDWTGEVLRRLDDPHAAPPAVAALTPVHWADGALIDLPRIAARLRSVGSALVIDATQAAGVMPLDVIDLQPDFLAFPAYKWLFGPYGCAFLYVHPKHQAGIPLEHHMGNRVFPDLAVREGRRDFAFKPGAQRFDRGERDDGVLISTAIAGLELLHTVKPVERLEHVRQLSTRLCNGLDGLPLELLPDAVRAPHIVSLKLKHREALTVTKSLEQFDVFTSARLGNLRVSPWLYNGEADIDRLVTNLAAVLRD